MINEVVDGLNILEFSCFSFEEPFYFFFQHTTHEIYEDMAEGLLNCG